MTPEAAAVKQVIVVRADLKDTNGRKVRTGKLIAQGGHAAIAWMINQRLENGTPSVAQKQWMYGLQKKICLQVDSEDALLDVYERAKLAGLETHMIIDAGLTEFGGVPTRTCLAIGPNHDEDIDKITGDLKLL